MFKKTETTLNFLYHLYFLTQMIFLKCSYKSEKYYDGETDNLLYFEVAHVYTQNILEIIC